MSTHASSPLPSGDGTLSSSTHASAIPTLAVEPSGPSDMTGGEGTSSPGPLLSRRSTTRLSRTNTLQNAKDREAKALSKASNSSPPASAGLDPLSTQIYLRTNSNTEPTIAQRLRSSGRPDSPTHDNLQRLSTDSYRKPANASVDGQKERKKGTSFLSRLTMRGAWKRDDETHDSDSDLGDLRTEGSSARALTSVLGAGGGFIPFYKEPPRYIRVRPHNKRRGTFNRLFLAQELLGTKAPSDDEPQSRAPATAVGKKLLKGGDAIWAAEFSMDGRYLAVAGKDQKVRVFAVLSTPEERQEQEDEEEKQDRGNGERLCAPVFRSKPVREFEGHTGEVLALSWSKNNFLLSSSMDKTVVLWHMSRAESICTFKHSDLVTSIAFHPTDDRFFLAGSLDAQLRLWSIPDKSVAFSAPTGEFITAAAFAPDGKTAICGLLSGHCMFYETEGLKLQSQIHVRSSRGKNAKGSKITGIRTATIPPGSGDVKVLISSNDSRVRMYGLKTKMLEFKLKGLENQSSQIHARFSDDSAWIISGSEDRRAYIWGVSQPEAELKDKQPYETFDAHPEVVTTALMAPTKSRLLLSSSGDPIYDLCNPPPVTLLSLDEKSASQTTLSEAEQAACVPGGRKPDESPAYIERSKHFDGNIIITTDRTGTIKVFRQDCAFTKRQQSMWETGSKFSGKRNGVGRSASIITKTSNGSRVHSRRGSLNLGPSPALAQPPSDRIMSWRQDIDGARASLNGTTRSDRSLSPSKVSRSPINISAANLASEARKQPYVASPVLRPNNPASPTGSVRTNATSLRFEAEREREREGERDQGPAQPPTPSFSLISASDSDRNEDKGEGSFWNLSRWKGGISGLRYSTTANSSGGDGASKDPTGHGRKGSDNKETPFNRAAARRSLGVQDLSRLKIADDSSSRRKSMGPVLRTVPPETDSLEESSIDSRLEEMQSRRLPGKKRTDSGVAQVSAESTDDSDGAACRGCGSQRFKVEGGGERRCVKCGVACDV